MSLFSELDLLDDVANASPEAIARCLKSQDAGLEAELFGQARALTQRRFGLRIALFAPLYVSDVCVNNCLYCGFRRDNVGLRRRTLTEAELKNEAAALAAMGHGTVLIVAGEHPRDSGPQAIAEAVRVVRAVPGIQDVKVEVMPMTVEGYRRLGEAGAGAVVLYQETYDRPTYLCAHPSGPKANYDWRLGALDRAIEAGFRRVGMGILLGLSDPARDFAALIAHARSLHSRWGLWPSTVSLPRLQPAESADWSTAPPRPVGDRELTRLIALVRIALPEAGIILSTREQPALRDWLLQLGIGVTHLSAGSRTSVGGYTQGSTQGQFSIQDDRPVPDVMGRLQALGYEPVGLDNG